MRILSRKYHQWGLFSIAPTEAIPWNLIIKNVNTRKKLKDETNEPAVQAYAYSAEGLNGHATKRDNGWMLGRTGYTI